MSSLQLVQGPAQSSRTAGIVTVVFRILKGGGTFQVYIFKSVQILAYFCTLKLVGPIRFFISKEGGGWQAAVRGPTLNTSLCIVIERDAYVSPLPSMIISCCLVSCAIFRLAFDIRLRSLDTRCTPPTPPKSLQVPAVYAREW